MDSLGWLERAHRFANHHARAISTRGETPGRLRQRVEVARHSIALSRRRRRPGSALLGSKTAETGGVRDAHQGRSEEHTSELQSHSDLVCRLLLEKKKKKTKQTNTKKQHNN